MNKVLLTLLGLILVGLVYPKSFSQFYAEQKEAYLNKNKWLIGCKNFCKANSAVPGRCYQRCEEGDTYPEQGGWRHSLTGELSYKYPSSGQSEIDW
jgi:hypothetical protein